MRIKTTYILALLLACLLFISGCATEGRNVQTTFEKYDDYDVLQNAMNKLKVNTTPSFLAAQPDFCFSWKRPWSYLLMLPSLLPPTAMASLCNSKQQQYSAVRNLRYLTKYMKEPGKQELAIYGLTYLVAFVDDQDVQELAASRLDVIMKNETWDPALKLAVIQAKRDIVLGALGFTIYNDGKAIHFPAEDEARDQALAFLIDRFPDLSPYLQYQTMLAFQDILLAEPTLDNCSFKLCDEYGRQHPELWKASLQADWTEDFQDYKETVWNEIEDWLEDEDIRPLVKNNLARFAGDIKQFHLLPEMIQDFQEQAAEWRTNDDIPVEIRELITASLEKVRLYENPPVKEPELEDTVYSELPSQAAAFMETHLGAILFQQHLRQERLAGINTLIPEKEAESATEVSDDDAYEIEKALDQKPIQETPKVTANDQAASNAEKAPQAGSVETPLKPLPPETNVIEEEGEAADETKPIVIRDLTPLILKAGIAEEQERGKQEIIYQTAAKALKRGLILENQDLVNLAATAISNAVLSEVDDPVLSLQQILKVIQQLYPSIKKLDLEVNPLFDALATAAAGTQDLIKRRLFLYTLVAGAYTHPDRVQAKLDILPIKLDVVTRHRIKQILLDAEKARKAPQEEESLIPPSDSGVQTIEVNVPDQINELESEQPLPDESALPADEATVPLEGTGVSPENKEPALGNEATVPLEGTGVTPENKEPVSNKKPESVPETTTQKTKPPAATGNTEKTAP